MKKKTIIKLKIFASVFAYLLVLSNILFMTYNVLNHKSYSIYFLISSIIIALITALIIINLSKKYQKRILNIKKDTAGLLTAIPIIIFSFFIISCIYSFSKENKIYKENILLFENYQKYYSFDNGMEYRLDTETKELCYMNDYKLISIKPVNYYDLKSKEIKVYEIDGKLFVKNGKNNYITTGLEVTDVLYKIDETISGNYESYFILENKEYLEINYDYKSEQIDNFLYLYKRYNSFLYVQEKMVDLRIQILNNFETSQLAKFKKRHIEIPINNKMYKLIYTFNKSLEVIYNKKLID